MINVHFWGPNLHKHLKYVCFFLWQVVELISSAIGDLVQGIYYENSYNIEVKHLLFLYIPTFWACPYFLSYTDAKIVGLGHFKYK